MGTDLAVFRGNSKSLSFTDKETAVWAPTELCSEETQSLYLKQTHTEGGMGTDLTFRPVVSII